MDEHPRADLAATLERHGQQHLLDGVSELDAETRERFLERLVEVDWAELERHVEPLPLAAVEPPPVVTLDDRTRRADILIPEGERAYRDGCVAVVMVAGGQGTRLGFPGPKGCLPLAPHSGKSIYQLQAEKILSLSRRVGRTIPFLVMTSPATDAETRAFFDEHADFGLAEAQARFFVQGTLPSLDLRGKALLAAPGRLLENPDGHGGSFTALTAGGILDDLSGAGVTHLVYVQVDNVLAPVDDPVLVGLAVSEGADVVTKVLEKAHPDEKVGSFVRTAGRDRVVEYTELPAEQARAIAPDDRPLYRWASPALHCWSLDFLARLADRGYRPPLHRSAKPLEAWSRGTEVEVDGWKHERFVFDLIPEAERSLGLEVARAEEFAPVKNADGDDSPATAVELAHRQHVEWLEAAGVRVELPPGDRVEIDPLLAATREQFLERWDGRFGEVTSGCYLEAADRGA